MAEARDLPLKSLSQKPGGALGAKRLRRGPIHGDDILGAGILQKQRRIVRRKSEPQSKVARHRKPFEAGHLLDLTVRNANPLDPSILPRTQEINVVAVMREGRISDDRTGKDRPLLRLEIIELQPQGVIGQGGQVAAIGRPTRRKHIGRVRERGDFMSLKVHYSDGYPWSDAGIPAENN